jgi:sec-independent protein translocase protein TatB
VLGNLGFGELLAIVVIGLLVFGPERLPGVARDAGRALRQMRTMLTGVQRELQDQLGPELAEFDVASMDPRQMVQQALMAEDEAAGGTGAGAGGPSPRQRRTLAAGEPAPFDPDAT